MPLKRPVEKHKYYLETLRQLYEIICKTRPKNNSQKIHYGSIFSLYHLYLSPYTMDIKHSSACVDGCINRTDELPNPPSPHQPLFSLVK